MADTTSSHQGTLCLACTIRGQRSQPLPPRTGQSQPRRVAAGIDQHDGRRPRDSTLSLRSSSSLPPSSASCPPHTRLTPATSHLPGKLSGCQDPAAIAYNLPCKCLGWDLRATYYVLLRIMYYVLQHHRTRCLSICQSTRQSILSTTQSQGRHEPRSTAGMIRVGKWAQQGLAYCLDEAQPV